MIFILTVGAIAAVTLPHWRWHDLSVAGVSVRTLMACAMVGGMGLWFFTLLRELREEVQRQDRCEDSGHVWVDSKCLVGPIEVDP